MTVTMDPQHQESAGHLRDHVALVTGGTRGIGAAIGHAIAEQGAAVAAGYWRHDEPAERGSGRIINVSSVIGETGARLGRPEEIARVVTFLAADQSAYITGQIWAVNGGMDM